MVAKKTFGEQEIAVADAFLAGEKPSHIAHRLNVSNTAVEDALRRRDVYKPSRRSPHDFSEAEKQQIFDMYLNKGMSTCSIAKNKDMRPGSIRNVLLKANLKLGRNCRDRTLNLPSDPAIIGYLAGIIDGEGSMFARSRPGRRLQVIVTVINTDANLLNWLKRFGGQLRWRKNDAGHFGKKRVGVWELTRKLDVEPLVEAVLPYLIVKKADAVKVLAAIRS